jgi:hypothetical protein
MRSQPGATSDKGIKALPLVDAIFERISGSLKIQVDAGAQLLR